MTQAGVWACEVAHTLSRIYLSPPEVGPYERQMLLDALDSNWLAPLGPDVDAFELEISVLSPLAKISSPEEVEVGLHGLYLEKNFSRGVLLPQVATEQGWDRETFLNHTALKAGLKKDDWKEGADIYVFTAQVFGEH